jgi:RNase P protein component
LIYDRIEAHWDLVFIIRTPAVSTVEFTHLQATIEQLLQRAGVLREYSAQPA